MSPICPKCAQNEPRMVQMARKVSDGGSTAKMEWKVVIKKVWNQYLPSDVHKLVKSFQQWVDHAIKNKGSRDVAPCAFTGFR